MQATVQTVILDPAIKEQRRHGTRLFPIDAHHYRGGLPADQYVSLHWHDEIEIDLIYEGTFLFFTPSIRERTTGPHIRVIPSCRLHGSVDDKNGRSTAILFKAEALELSAYDEVITEVLRPLATGAGILQVKPLTAACPYFAEIFSTLNFVCDHAKTTRPSEQLRVKAHLLEAIALMHECGYSLKHSLLPEKTLDKEQRLKDLLTYISDNYKKPLSIEDLAQRLHVTHEYFCRFFKKQTGKTFVEYLNDLRLSRAAHELLLSPRPAAEIAAGHGFDNTAYFFRLFRKKFAMTPRDYRARAQLQVKSSPLAASAGQMMP